MFVIWKRSLLAVCVSFAGALSCVADAQKSQVAAPAFDVSTVRPSVPDARDSNLGVDSIRSTNMPVIYLLKFAFNLSGGSNDQIIGAPAWVLSDRFDIRAKTDEETAVELKRESLDEHTATLRTMVLGLLNDRFALRVHHETRELPVMALGIAKGGPKLERANDASSERLTQTDGRTRWYGLRNPRPGETEGRAAPMTLLAQSLSDKVELGGRLIVDETGLTGTYNFKLVWSPEDPHSSQGSPSAGGPSLITALQEQLGLVLKRKKALVDCIVIDSIAQPSPN